MHVLLLLTLLAPPPHPDAGAVLRVGPTRTHTTIQSAVDAAQTGDLVLVDPGAYPSFVIRAKGIAVVAAGAPFFVTMSTTAPAIAVRDVAYPDQVTVVGARVTYTSTASPAVHLRGNSGAVRFSQLDVDLAANLCNAVQEAAVLVETTATFWLIDSRVWTTTARRGSTLLPTGANDAVSAVSVKDSDGVVQNCQLRGFDSCGTYAGDAMRMAGDTSILILDDYVQSPLASTFQGGQGGSYGGNALHYLGPKSGLSKINHCGRAALQPGQGSVQNGGMFALNNDGGQVQPNVQRLPAVCLGQHVAQTSCDAPVVALGGTVTLRVWTVTPRGYIVFGGVNTAYKRNLFGLVGRGMLDVFAPAIVLSTGATNGTTANVINLPVPNLAVLSGVQLTFQSLVGPVNGTGTTLGFPSLVVVTT